MTTITASMVNELRQRTGSGMMDCKKALVEANGDIEQAVENMRKAGQAQADKKASKVTAEGMVAIESSEDNKHAVMVEVNCQTDFVAIGDDFKKFVKDITKVALQSNSTTPEQLLEASYDQSHTVDQARRNLVAKIGENINIRRLVNIKAENPKCIVGAYLHGSKIGVVVELEGGVPQLAKDLAMHIAASSPMVVNPSDVPQEFVAKEKEIFTAQASQSGKPAEIIEKMISGRINKMLDEVSLTGQPYVKDPNTTVGKLLKAENAKVSRFTRYSVGEGIEKEVVDFATEVMAQVKG
jgi:elongation factor Ts